MKYEQITSLELLGVDQPILSYRNIINLICRAVVCNIIEPDIYVESTTRSSPGKWPVRLRSKTASSKTHGNLHAIPHNVMQQLIVVIVMMYTLEVSLV